MRLFLINLFLFTFVSAQAQDGSDIRYLDASYLNDSHKGRLCHIDTKNNYFRTRITDTVKIYIQGKMTSFIEHRVDDGFNNWFVQQYLEALPLKKNTSTRITYFRIDSITSNKLYVSGFVSYYNNGMAIDTITPIQHIYLKKDISKVLLKSKSYGNKD